jgi:hypothetical protein
MITMSSELTAPAHYRGPGGVANGGWIAGTVASHLPAGGTVEVTLRRPVPVEHRLRMERDDADQMLLSDTAGGEVLAEARPVAERPEPPPFVPVEDAEKAGLDFAGHREHPMPDCFVCGHRAPGEGLLVHPGPTGRDGEYAALWRVHPLLAEWSATLPLSHVWGALDCPTGWAHFTSGGYALLGRLTARVRRSVFTGGTYVVVARRLGRQGRELHAGAALYETDGTLVAASRAVWIAVEPGRRAP